MCGRYALNASSSQVLEHFQLKYEEDLRNTDLRTEKEVFPSKIEEVVVRIDNQNILEKKTWGLSKLVIKGNTLKDSVNVATIEKLAKYSLWSKALKKHRLLIPATSYFEWKELDKFTKEKYEIYNPDNHIFAFAGLNIIYVDSEMKRKECFVIITTEANEKIKNIHHRQPAIVKQENYNEWLDDNNNEPIKLLNQFASIDMTYKLIMTKSKKKNEDHPTLF
ncbi:SOS response-associated peptidase [Leptospira vanthielii]|uniref:Abasic site processing protein n=1 Tax=Leptospira vanthielii TaxID=293085 RepID=A0ABY2NKF5_9LEPT|nr:SOS response-associated peptidase family protein [Leptospira vanthielii]TGM46001.1 hypothetical protein EHQ95_17610 [Leptospira vanthielii]